MCLLPHARRYVSERLDEGASRILSCLDRPLPPATSHQIRMMQESARIGVWGADLTSGSVTWDEGLCKLCGLALGEAPSDLNAWLTLVHPEDRSAARAAFADDLAELECRIQTAGGGWDMGPGPWRGRRVRLRRPTTAPRRCAHGHLGAQGHLAHAACDAGLRATPHRGTRSRHPMPRNLARRSRARGPRRGWALLA